MKIILIIFFFFISSNIMGSETHKPLWFTYADPTEGIEYQMVKMPEWVVERAEKLDFDKKYDLSFHINPFYLTVDFDSDNKMDVAVWVKERSSGKKGVAIFIQSQKIIHVAGAGVNLGMGDGDYSWADLWLPLDKTELKQSHWEKKPPGNIGQGIRLTQFESSSSAIYWNGKSIEWYQVSD